MDGQIAVKTPILQNPTLYYYAWDHLGTIRLVTDENGATVDVHDYSPFGLELLPSTNLADNTHQFTGQERDQTSGFDYFHFRYYAGSMGRFLKPDNVSGNAMNPQDWNLYSYVHGNPVNLNDPTGHDGILPGRSVPASACSSSEKGTVEATLKSTDTVQIVTLKIKGSQKEIQALANKVKTKTGNDVHATSKDGKNWTFTVTGKNVPSPTDPPTLNQIKGPQSISASPKEQEKNYNKEYHKAVEKHAPRIISDVSIGIIVGWAAGSKKGFWGSVFGIIVGGQIAAWKWVGICRAEAEAEVNKDQKSKGEHNPAVKEEHVESSELPEVPAP